MTKQRNVRLRKAERYAKRMLDRGYNIPPACGGRILDAGDRRAGWPNLQWRKR